MSELWGDNSGNNWRYRYPKAAGCLLFSLIVACVVFVLVLVAFAGSMNKDSLAEDIRAYYPQYGSTGELEDPWDHAQYTVMGSFARALGYDDVHPGIRRSSNLLQESGVSQQTADELAVRIIKKGDISDFNQAWIYVGNALQSSKYKLRFEKGRLRWDVAGSH